MEPVTHFLTGACLGRAGFNRLTGLATITMTLAAEAPDIDMLWMFDGPVTNFQHHRGITHTFIGAPFMAALVVGVVWLVHRAVSRGRKESGAGTPVRWGVLYGLALLATLSHILLDYTNSYGVRPFFPFRANWYAWDIVFVVEPILLVVLFLGLVLPSLLGLVAAEVSQRGTRFRGRGPAIFALVAMVAYWVVCDSQHRIALRILN
ncbi:MAG: metal-dependent hydrolase, partial [Acidobacteriales bacterium]|nr:metal-dependent hydrolase [Terriglobales bacterium]